MTPRASAMDKAQAAWGSLPDWVAALAQACDAHGLRQIAAKMQVSPAIVSLAINNKHHAPLDFIRDKVTAHLAVSIVSCPVLGMLPLTDCREKQIQPFSSSPVRLQLFRACRGGCKHYIQPKEKEKTC